MQNNGALGGLGSTTIESGAALHLDSTANGDLQGGDNTTNIYGTGIAGTGAIRNVLGANNYTGQITLNAPSLVTANNATTLALSGGTTGANHDLTIGTAAQNGNIVISGAMSNGTGQLTKEGSGDLTFGKSTGITGTVGLTHLNGGTLTVGLDGTTLDSQHEGHRLRPWHDAQDRFLRQGPRHLRYQRRRCSAPSTRSPLRVARLKKPVPAPHVCHLIQFRRQPDPQRWHPCAVERGQCDLR